MSYPPSGEDGPPGIGGGGFGFALSSKIIFNKNGDKSVAGENGKYYCGNGNLQCECCDGSCGPDDGCNCSACMELDVQTRGLTHHYLVNRNGDPSEFNTSEDRFYCGKKATAWHNRAWDGYCGPNNGPQCDNCEILQSQSKTRYQGNYCSSTVICALINNENHRV